MPDNSMKGVGFPEKDILPDIQPRRTYVLAIAIDQYEHHHVLHNCERDVEGLIATLSEHYQFKELIINRLYNDEATRARIYMELKRLPALLTEEDDFILLFSGHGHYDRLYDEGWWVPFEARLGSEDGFLANDDVRRLLRPINAQHVLLIVDACFSGTITRSAPLGVNKLDNKPSRWALTSGRLEPVFDGVKGQTHSPFVTALISELKSNTQPFLRVPTLGDRLKDIVPGLADQMPDSQPVDKCGHLGGEMVLLRKQTVVVGNQHDMLQRTAYTDIGSNLRSGSKSYFDLLQDGRFKHLIIADGLLTDMKGLLIDTQVRVDLNYTPLRNSLKYLYQKTPATNFDSSIHAMLYGDGGMGKTVSVVRLWKELLEENETESPIPIFIALNEFNNTHEQGKFVFNYIARNYLGREFLSLEEEASLKEFLKKPLSEDTPNIVLLLDGFNEVTIEKRPLLLELNYLVEHFKAIQILVTTRYGINDTWATDFTKVELIPLTKPQIDNYLSEVSIQAPNSDNERLWRLLENPMMLTLYAGVGRETEKYRRDTRIDFKTTISTPGELIWNFIEIQLAKQLDPSIHDEKTQAYLYFLVRGVLPYIAYRMEEAGQFFIGESGGTTNLEKTIKEALLWFDKPETIQIFPYLRPYLSQLDLGSDQEDWRADALRFDRALHALTTQLKMLVPENGSYRFLHQNFRDALAAVWILHDIKFNLKLHERHGKLHKQNPESICSRRLPGYLLQLIGEIAQEYHHAPFWNTDRNTWGAHEKPDSDIKRQLDLFRHETNDAATQLGISNIIQLIVYARETLAGEDLSHLDLTGCMLHGIHFSFGSRYPQVATNFEGATIKASLLFPQGHYEAVTCLAYDPINHRVVTGAVDLTIRVWDLNTGECLKKFEGHKQAIRAVAINAAGDKVVSASNDYSIREWDVHSGTCLQILKGHSHIVSYVSYAPSGEKIVSGSWDKTIREWDLKSGNCLQIIPYNHDTVNSVQYNPSGSVILGAFLDGCLEEWDVATGRSVRSLQAHTSLISEARYSFDGTQIVSGSYDKSICIWDRNSATNLLKIDNLGTFVSSVDISADGRKILSGHWDGTVKEWDAVNGECLRIFKGHRSAVTRVKYNLKEKKLISVSEDLSMREWSQLTGECIQVFKGFPEGIVNVFISPEGLDVMTIARNGCLALFDVSSGVFSQFVYRQKESKNIIFSADGQKFAFSQEQYVIEWDVHKNKVIGYFHNIELPNKLFYSPDGSMLLTTTSAGDAALWSTKTYKLIKFLFGSSSIIHDADFSADGKKIIALNSKGQMIEWHIDRNEKPKIIAPILDRVTNNIQYSTSDNLVVLSGNFNSVREYNLQTGETNNVHDNKNVNDEADQGSTTLVKTSRSGSPLITFNRNKSRLLLLTSDGFLFEYDWATKSKIYGIDIDAQLFKSTQKQSWVCAKYHPKDEDVVLLYTKNFVVCYARLKDTILSFFEFRDVPGLRIQQCNFKDVTWKETGLEPEKWRKLMRLYGGIIDVEHE